MKIFLSLLLMLSFSTGGICQTAGRAVMVNSNGVVITPANFWANAPIGTINGTNISRPNLGFSANLDTFWLATSIGQARTNLGLGADWLTNTSSSTFRSAIGLGWSALTNTNPSTFRSDIGLGWSALTNTTSATFRSDIGLGWSALTNTTAATFRSDIGLGWAALTNTTAATFRSDVGLGWAALTNTNSANFRSAIALNWAALTNSNSSVTTLVGVNSNGIIQNTNLLLRAKDLTIGFTHADNPNTQLFDAGRVLWANSANTVSVGENNSATVFFPSGISVGGNGVAGPNLTSGGLGNDNSGTMLAIDTYPAGGGWYLDFRVAPTFTNTAAQTRTNLGLGWSALTNTTASSFKTDIGFNASLDTLWTATNATIARAALSVPSRLGDGVDSVIGGGSGNSAPGWYSVVGGGQINIAAGGYTAGVLSNVNAFTSVLGGFDNTAMNSYASVGGGLGNDALGYASTVPGGWMNIASGDYSFAAGNYAFATNARSFVWNSGSADNTFFSSERTNTFNVRAQGGMTLDLGTFGISFRNTASVAPTRTNLGLGASWLTNSTVATFRSDIGLGWSALTNTSAATFRSDIGLGWSALTNTNSANFRSAVGLGWSALTNTTAATFRSDIGLGWSALTNTSVDSFRTAIGLGPTNLVVFSNLLVSGNSSAGFWSLNVAQFGDFFAIAPDGLTSAVPIVFSGTNNAAATTRTNLGLGASWLTNSVLADFRTAISLGSSDGVSFSSVRAANGTVTNLSFQIGAADTGFYNAQGPNKVNVVVDGANAAIFTPNTVTAPNVSAGNLNITAENGAISFVFPATAAITRTNLGLGSAWLTNTVVANFLAAIELGTTNTPQFAGINLGNAVQLGRSGTSVVFQVTGSDRLSVDALGATLNSGSLRFATNNSTGAAATRTNLGLGAGWLTNSSSPLFWTNVPTATNSAGVPGSVAYTNNYFYICVQTNTWRRVLLGVW